MNKLLLSLGISTTILFGATITDGKQQFTDKKYKKAYQTFMQVANDGMVAKFNIGYMYEQGLGVKKDINKAINFYILSANDGYSVAQNTLGNAYLKGIGVKKDIKTAIRYYQLSAQQKNKNAIKALNDIQNLINQNKKLEIAKKEKQKAQPLAYLTVRSNINNDRVYLDGKYMGKTKIILPISSGVSHKLEVRKKGWFTYKFKDIILKPKQKQTIRARLVRVK